MTLVGERDRKIIKSKIKLKLMMQYISAIFLGALFKYSTFSNYFLKMLNFYFKLTLLHKLS